MIPSSERPSGSGFDHARERLEQLYEISNLFAGFESVDTTVSTALGIMGRTLALRSAVLIVDGEGFSQTAVWRAPGVSEEALRAVEVRAHAVCARLTGLDHTDANTRNEPRTDSGILSGAAIDAVAGACEQPNVLLLPLVIAEHPCFGALQLEVSARLGEPDLAFASAITHQLAVTLDRYRSLNHAMALRDRAEALARSEKGQRLVAQAARAEAEMLAAQLMHQKNWLRALLDLVPVPLLLVDTKAARITFANRAADAVAGGNFLRGGSTAEQNHLSELTDASERRIPIDEVPVVRVARGELLTSVQMHWHAGAGTKSLLLNSGLLPASDGYPATALITFEDITELTESETALREAVNQRDEFISIASHELRNPVNAIQLMLAMLQQASAKTVDKPSSEWIAGRLTRCRAQIARLTRLIDNLLDVSRLTAGRLNLELEDDVNLSAAVRDEIERIRSENPRASITLRAGEDVSGAWDRLRLDQVVANLLSNAVKYGGDHPIEVSVESSGEAAQLVVTDHGIGIAPEDQLRVFARFERAVPGRKFIGFGLGLWIAKQIVEAMKGTISLTSKVGEGATFTVLLPRS